ncbi:MAG: CHAP domain-containing protein [Eubacteriales bacterium]|nr:CHAP domain-containing protein [Eubacteriales bacterium]
MPDIKTKESVRDIKVLDAKAIAKEHMKTTAVRTKDMVENLSDDGQVSPSEYAEDNISHAMENVADDARVTVSRGIRKADNRRRNRRTGAGTYTSTGEGTSPNYGAKTEQKSRSTARKQQDGKSYGAGAIKTRESENTIRNAPKSSRKKPTAAANAKIRTRESAAVPMANVNRKSIRTRQMKWARGNAAKKAAAGASKVAGIAKRSLKAMVKNSIAAINKLVTAIATGGGVAVMSAILICMVGLIVASSFGIFFSSEDTGSEMTMRQAVQEINTEYQNKIDVLKANYPHDKLEMKGSRAVWPEVLSVYAVKLTTDADNPQEVATVTPEKKRMLEDIFWAMNKISSKTELKQETEITEKDDGHGNIVGESVQKSNRYLYIEASHKTADEMAAQYHFSDDQKQQLSELLAQDSKMWSAVLYGIYGSNDDIVSVALSQLGNVGGEPYWSWYGFNSRVEWCACFVSWCADQCGYIEAGICPKYAGCSNGVQWFKERGQWLDNTAEPAPGMVIFFDWDNKGDSGPKDGSPDHTGIVEKVDNGMIYTVEGNSGDACVERMYPLGYYEVLGYGVLIV